MTRMKAWPIGGLGFVALVLVGWPGSADAAKWANPDLLATPEAVKANIGKPDWVVVDCRSLKDYIKGHIPGAISLGNKCSSALRDATSRMFRDPSRYEKLLGKVGIGNDTHVVFYHGDMGTLTSATVAFWVLEQLGHDKVQVLNGGLDAWRKAGNRLESKPTIKKAVSFKAEPIASRYAATDEILEIAKGQASGVQLIDSRTDNEFKGKDVRAIRGGHVPNVTIQISHKDTLAQRKNSKTGKMERVAYFDPDEVENAFGSLDKSKRTIAYCQTGTRSTMTYLQLRLAGFADPANWDESWRVWGSQLEYPVADEQWYNFAGVNKKIKNLEKKVKKLEASATE